MDQEQETQPVVTDGDTQQGAENESESARNENEDWDKLLSQFDQETKPPEGTQPPAQPEPKDDQAVEMVRALERRIEEQQFQTDMKDVVSVVRGDLSPELFDDSFIEAWVDAQARRDPKLQNAWINRHSNPTAFSGVKETLGKQFAKSFSNMTDPNASEDREAVAQAVKGASGPAPDSGKAPNYSSMSDQEFAEKVEKEHGFRPL